MKLASLKRVLLIVAALVVLGALLAGCGGSSSSSSSSGSGHSSEWTPAKEAEFYAKLDQKATAGDPQLAHSASVKAYGTCLLAGFKPLYSPSEVLSEKSKEPKKAAEIAAACETKYRPVIEAEAKKSAESKTGATSPSGSTGGAPSAEEITKAKSTESNLKQEEEKRIKEETEAKANGGSTGSTGG